MLSQLFNVLKSHTKGKVTNPYFHFTRVHRTPITQLATIAKNCSVRDMQPEATYARSSGTPLKMIVAMLLTRQRPPVS